MRIHTRRSLLRRAGLVAAGSVVGRYVGVADASTLGGPTPQPAQPTGPAVSMSPVTAVTGSQVQISGSGESYQLEGFPAGWETLVGDLVVIAPSFAGSGVTAQPVLNWTVAEAAAVSLNPGATIGATDSLEVLGATVLAFDVAEYREEGDVTVRALEVATVGRASSSGPDRAIAIHLGT